MPNDGQAKPGASFLGSVVRFKHRFQEIGRYPRAIVLNDHTKSIITFVASFYLDFAAITKHFASILNYVNEHFTDVLRLGQ